MAAMKTTLTFLVVLISALALSSGVASAATREYEGTVVSVNRDARTFRLHDSERGTIRIRVTRSTRFERINGFSGLRKGQKRIEATVRRSNGRWVATEVERSGGGGSRSAAAATTTDPPGHAATGRGSRTTAGAGTTSTRPSSCWSTPPRRRRSRRATSGPDSSAAFASTSASNALPATAVAATSPVHAGRPVAGSRTWWA